MRRGRPPGGYGFSKKQAKKPPATPAEAIEALKASKFQCKPCRARFLTQESLEAHREYHANQKAQRRGKDKGADEDVA